MRKIIGMFIAMLMAVPLVMMSPTPANAADCNAATARRTTTLNTEDGADMTFYVEIHFTDCVGYRVFRYVKMGYAPSGLLFSWGDGGAIECGSNGGFGEIYDVHMNLGNLLGHDPGYKDFGDCNGWGESVTYDWADRGIDDSNTSADRCVGASVKAFIRNWSDFEDSVPLVCI